ncbi:hypothetical protein DEU56DRAFT_906301 [Suillus clintonianus]|uniref:uncharacterized protein n=1 Tax=Suillus clintonianus TaxID=1904413 RepID=UPI001B881A81|nr:uncharacterized protein DEU56DRAFT_906301 [Suillus clintonianus]KAG2156129.1 hypothetical protein DEU56DRAFT_906301 [Suillus clintonianus]
MSAPKLSSRTPSYRKPVPKFIPSPPASPHGSPTSSTRRFSFSHASVSQDAPPLPPDWRNAIDRAVSREGRTTSVLPAIDTVVGPSSHDTHGTDTEFSTERLSPSTPDWGTSGMNFTPPTPTESCHDEELVSRPSSPTPWEHLMRSTVKQPSYQEEYRPPTPPLPNQRKRPRSTESGCDSPTPTIISQLAPHSTLPLASEHGAAPSISIEPPPLPPKSSLPTPPASLLTHDHISYHAGHDKSSQPPPTYSPGHDRRPSTLNSTLNFTLNSDKWTEGTAPSAQGLINLKTEAPGDSGSEFPAVRDVASRTKRSWWLGFKHFMSSLCCW